MASLSFIASQHTDIYPAIDPTKTDLSQPGKTVLITGGGRGIGRSTALRYAEAGVASIILCARTKSELGEVEQSIHNINSSIKVFKHQLDVTNDAQVAQIAGSIEKLDVLINNAGSSHEWDLLTKIDPKEWWGAIEVSLKGPYLLTRYLLPKMVKGGHVLNTSSIGADMITPNASGYQIAKFALNRLTEFTQAEFPDVECVCFHPGGVVTQLSSKTEAIRPYLNDTAELPAGFMVWLTKERRQWLGGRFLYANWDVEELVKKEDEVVSGDLLKMKVAF